MSGFYSGMRCYAFPSTIAGRKERGVFAMLKAFDWFDELYEEHLAKFGDILEPVPNAEITDACLSAWSAFDSGVNDSLGDLQSWMDGEQRAASIDKPTGPIGDLIAAFAWNVHDVNVHAIGLLYLAEKLGYMPKGAASFSFVDGVDDPFAEMWKVWDIGAEFIVLIPSEHFEIGWTDAGHSETLAGARDIAADYKGSRIFQRTGESWAEVLPVAASTEIDTAA